MDEVKKQLVTIKRQISRISNWFLENKKTNDIYLFEIKLEQIQQFYAKYVDLMDDINELNDEAILAECETMDNKYCETVSGIKRIISEFNTAKLEHTVTGQQNPTAIASVAKLPEIVINPFSGDFSEWNSFYELFENLIIKNSCLSDVQKFVYLKSYLKGEPLALINSLQLSSNNFQVAVNTLKERYQNRLRIVNAHIKHLIVKVRFWLKAILQI